MKKITLMLILLGVFSVFAPGSTAAANTFKLSNTILQQTVPSQHKVNKKRRRVRRHAVTGRSARAQMQLRQAQKHLADEQKVKAAQQELKRDTSKSN